MLLTSLLLYLCMYIYIYTYSYPSLSMLVKLDGDGLFFSVAWIVREQTQLQERANDVSGLLPADTITTKQTAQFALPGTMSLSCYSSHSCSSQSVHQGVDLLKAALRGIWD